MSANRYLVDVSTRHQVFLQRHTEREAKKIAKAMQSIAKEISNKITSTEFQANRQEALLDEISKIIAVATGKLGDEAQQAAFKLAVADAEFEFEILQKAVNVDLIRPAPEQVSAAYRMTPMQLQRGSRLDVGSAIEQFTLVKQRQLVSLVQNGFSVGDTGTDIARRVSSEVKIVQHNAAALVNTMLNHAASVAREEVLIQNSDVIEEERFIATLDSSTTLECAGHDQERYPVGKGPMPPLHWNCRSLRVPVIKPEFAIPGFKSSGRPSVGSDGAASVGAGKSFDSWLRSQPAEFQNSYFSSEEKGKLFRKGMKIDRFRTSDGEPLTLKQLQSMRKTELI